MNALLRSATLEDKHTVAGRVKARKIAAARAEWTSLMQRWPGESPLLRAAA